MIAASNKVRNLAIKQDKTYVDFKVLIPLYIPNSNPKFRHTNLTG